MPTQHLEAPCPSCNFPVAGQSGQSVSCPNCGISGTLSGVEVPNLIFWGGLGFLAGYLIAKSKVVGEKLAQL